MPRIMHIEDDEGIRNAMGRLFRANGFNYVQFGSAETAIKWLEKDWAFDAILSDYHMGSELTGVDVFDWVRLYCPILLSKFIFLSSSSKAEDLCSEAGIRFLEKPSSNSTILEAINQVVNEC